MQALIWAMFFAVAGLIALVVAYAPIGAVALTVLIGIGMVALIAYFYKHA